MFCANCGTKQNEGEKFCPNCGTRFEEPLKVEEVKAKEVVKSEASEPKESVPEITDDKVQIKAQTAKEEKSASVQSEESKSIIEADSTIDKGDKVEINGSTITLETSNLTVAESLETEEQGIESETTVTDMSSLEKQPKIEITEEIINLDVEKIELEELISEAANGDTEAQLRLAIKYELGLGVPADINKAEQLFAQIDNRINLLCFLYPQKSLEKNTGVISNSTTIVVECKTYFDSEKEKLGSAKSK